MGLFDNEDTSKMEEKDAEIANLRQQLLAAKSSKKESKVVLRGEDESEDESIRVRSVTIKLPAFNETNPELWFSRAESQFVSKGITSDTTKFHHLYALMTNKAANEIEALLLDPPKTGKVAAMRTKLVRRFDRSQYDKDTELLNTRSLGDMTPSQMWSKFQRLNKDPSNVLVCQSLPRLHVPTGGARGFGEHDLRGQRRDGRSSRPLHRELEEEADRGQFRSGGASFGGFRRAN